MAIKLYIGELGNLGPPSDGDVVCSADGMCWPVIGGGGIEPSYIPGFTSSVGGTTGPKPIGPHPQTVAAAMQSLNPVTPPRAPELTIDGKTLLIFGAIGLGLLVLIK